MVNVNQLYTLESDEDTWIDLIDFYEEEKLDGIPDECEDQIIQVCEEVNDLIDLTGKRFRVVIENTPDDEDDEVAAYYHLICTYSVIRRVYRIKAWISFDKTIASFVVMLQSFIRDADSKGLGIVLEMTDARLEHHKIMRKHKFSCDCIPVEHFLGEDGKYSNHIYRFKYFPESYLAGKKKKNKKAKDG